MDKVYMFGQTAENTMVNIRRIRNQASVLIIGQMEENMLGNG